MPVRRVVLGVRRRDAADPLRPKREPHDDVLELAVRTAPEDELDPVAQRLPRDPEEVWMLQTRRYRVVVRVSRIRVDRRLDLGAGTERGAGPEVEDDVRA